ncbi:MAG: hypothetical protein HOO96_19790 [Polyangiaceae bacterium]|nr:hypothetical protein [Polyangiaceae bacterium]
MALALGGCRGKLVAHADIRASGASAEVTTTLPAGATIWADTDGEWNGSKNSYMSVAYTIEVMEGGKATGSVTCDTSATESAVCGSITNIGGHHSGDCELRLATCKLPNGVTGAVTLKITAKTGANVTVARNLSLNFRVD